MKKISTLFTHLTLGLLLIAGTAFAQMYTITDLGTLGGTISVAYGINASGQVVGWSYTGAVDPLAGNISHAFRTAPNKPINPITDDLGTLGGYYSWAYGINDSGQVVGGSYLNTPLCCTEHAFRTKTNSALNPATDDLGTLGGFNSVAYGINNSGQVVGGSDDGIHTCPSAHGAFPAALAFRTQPNSAINPVTDSLGLLNGCWSTALGINSSGQAVGEAQTPNGLHAFRTAADQPINASTGDLGSLGGGTFTIANAINDFSQVVGYSWTGDNTYHSFRTASNSSINPLTDDLGPVAEAIWPAQPSPATAINNYGQVVGGAPAFVGGPGAISYLNKMIPADAGWKLIMAYGINDAGQIVGMGARGEAPGYGIGRAYLLTPIYRAFVQPPISGDGSSVFAAKRGTIPIKFRLTEYGVSTCTLLPATIAISRAVPGGLAAVSDAVYAKSSNTDSNFKMDPGACQYVYNVSSSALGPGTYRVDISVEGIMIGHAVFALV
jgi:probable HAF family extracellular repeat protein